MFERLCTVNVGSLQLPVYLTACLIKLTKLLLEFTQRFIDFSTGLFEILIAIEAPLSRILPAEMLVNLDDPRFAGWKSLPLSSHHDPCANRLPTGFITAIQCGGC